MLKLCLCVAEKQPDVTREYESSSTMWDTTPKLTVEVTLSLCTYPEEPVLLHTPRRGRFSAKLSVLREPAAGGTERGTLTTDPHKEGHSLATRTWGLLSLRQSHPPTEHELKKQLPQQEVCWLPYKRSVIKIMPWKHAQKKKTFLSALTFTHPHLEENNALFLTETYGDQIKLKYQHARH